MGVIITLILIGLVIKFATSQANNFDGVVNYWFILLVGIPCAIWVGTLFL